jgi:hypothetical protein
MIPDCLHGVSSFFLAAGFICAVVIAIDVLRHPRKSWIAISRQMPGAWLEVNSPAFWLMMQIAMLRASLQVPQRTGG